MKNKKTALAIFLGIIVAAVFFVSIFSSKKSPVNHQSFAMGSPIAITVYGEKNGEKTAASATEKIKELDSKYLSPVLNTSYAYSLNNERSITADEYFKEYIEKCIELSSNSEKFTLLSGQLKKLWNIENGGYVPTAEETEKLLPDLTDGNITVDGNVISLAGNGEVDFGALGKGTACQTALDYLKSQNVENAICTVGGTVGVIGKPDGKDEFSVGIRNPFGAQNEYFGTLNATDCFISTSGDYEKYFEKDGVRYCHIFDATTGAPVQNDLTSVTVVAKDGTVSDFLSTAIFCEGVENGLTLAKKYNAEVIIVKNDKTVIISEGLKDKFTLTDDEFMVIS